MAKISELSEELHELLHNTVHYLKVIGQLAYENRTAEICEIVEVLSGKLNREGMDCYCEHKMLDTILLEYRAQANEMGVHFDAYVEPGFSLGAVSDMDLINIMGNLLDNSITAAAEKAKKPTVKVRIFMEKEGRIGVIKVTNDFSGELKEAQGRLMTTKKDGGMHGLGMRSVSKTAEKYGGYLEYYVEDAQFNTIVVLPVQEERKVTEERQ